MPNKNINAVSQSISRKLTILGASAANATENRGMSSNLMEHQCRFSSNGNVANEGE